MDTRIASAGIILGGALLVVLAATGQEPHQEWQLKRHDDTRMVRFRVERFKRGSRSSQSTDLPRARFRGLPPEIFEQGGKVRFEFAGDAGALVCTGDFLWGRGSGTYTIERNPRFVSELERLGYETPREDQIFAMILNDVSLDLARVAQQAGLHATTAQLIDLRTHGVSVDYIDEALSAGYRDLSAQQIIDLRVHGVSTKFLRDLKTMGYELSPKAAIDLRIHGVTSEFAGDLKDAGYDLEANQIVDLRVHGVDSQYLRDLKRYGLQPDAADLVKLRTHGVTPDYLRGLDEAGLAKLTASDITDLRIHGVDPTFLKEAHALGYNFTARQFIDLRTRGVDGAYLRRIRDAGFQHLSSEQIMKLRTHGVD